VPRSAPEAPGERRGTRASRPPRRVSGPVGGKTAVRASRATAASRPKSAAATASRPKSPATTASRPKRATTARARRALTPPRGSRMPRAVAAGAGGVLAAAVALPLPVPRRLRPVPRRLRPVPRRESAPKTATGFLPRLGAFVVALPDHPWLDKVVRGRVWIPLLGVLLAGIVAAQVEILKLGANMGSSLEQTTTLTTQNEQLRYSVASLSNDQRIERLATSMGMVLPPPGSVGYLVASQRADVTRALGNLHAPDVTAFMALAPSNGALVTGAGTSMLPATPGVLAQAGTPGSATPTSTPSPTSTVASASSATTGGVGTTTGSTTGTTTGGTTGAPATTTSTPPPTTEQQTPTDSQTSTTDTQSPTTTPQPTATGTQSGSQAPATGAAAIQPAGGTQQSSGG
jgi:cell division protein FtsL